MGQYDTVTMLKNLLYQALLAKKENKGIDAIISSISVMLTKDEIASVKQEVFKDSKEMKDSE